MEILNEGTEQTNGTLGDIISRMLQDGVERAFEALAPMLIGAEKQQPARSLRNTHIKEIPLTIYCQVECHFRNQNQWKALRKDLGIRPENVTTCARSSDLKEAMAASAGAIHFGAMQRIAEMEKEKNFKRFCVEIFVRVVVRQVLVRIGLEFVPGEAEQKGMTVTNVADPRRN